MSRALAVAGAALIAASGDAVGRQLSFRILPATGEFEPSEAIGVSADGAVVVGGGGSPMGPEAFRWTYEDGIESLGEMPGGQYSVALGVSGDGGTVVGHGYLPGQGYQPFKWNRATGMTPLAPPGGRAYASAWDASFDGSVVIGDYNEGGAFVFESDGVARSIPLLFAQAITPDARLIVGTTSATIAAVYDLETGVRREMGYLPGHALSYGRDITPDGSVVVGTSFAGGYADERAFIWTEEVGAVMPIVGDGSFVARSAAAVSADGRVVLGNHDAGTYVWTEAEGARDLREILGDRIPEGLWLWSARGISADGTVLVGGGRFGFGGEDVAWVATIPNPAAFPVLAVLWISGRRGRSRRP